MAGDDTKGRILVVEDEAPIALALEDGLRLEGFQVEVVGDGQAGLDRALADPTPDVVILDMRLPKLDGMEVLRRLRAAGARRSDDTRRHIYLLAIRLLPSSRSGAARLNPHSALTAVPGESA